MPINVNLVFLSLYILFNINSFILAPVLSNTKTISFVFFLNSIVPVLALLNQISSFLFLPTERVLKGKTEKDNSIQDVYIQARLSLAIGHVFIINSKSKDSEIMLTNKIAFKPPNTILRQLLN